MKNFVRSLGVLVVIAALVPLAAQATTMTFVDYEDTGYYGSGEMDVVLKDDTGEPINGGEYFRAFCVDKDQHTSIGNTLSASVTPEGFRNGLGLQTAWLFDNFYTDGASKVEIAALQLALWNINDGYSPVGSSAVLAKANSYIASLHENFSSADYAYLNKTYTIFTSGSMQDLIVKTGAPVPEPTTMLLFVTGLLGVVGFSRRKTSK